MLMHCFQYKNLCQNCFLYQCFECNSNCCYFRFYHSLKQYHCLVNLKLSTLATMVADHSVNLVESLPKDERYDYNHRGKLQVLMHGLIHKSMESAAQYEIIHGNELLGVTPGEESNKPSDHAYVIAKLSLVE